MAAPQALPQTVSFSCLYAALGMNTQVAQAKLAYVIRSQVNLHTLRNLHVI